MSAYDVIVIGAGNGGLTAALTLARKGLGVLLLERHNVPGGSATSFCRGRFEFEVALHQLSGMGTPAKPGPLRMMLDGLGVMDDLTFVEMSDLYSVYMPDGFNMVLKPEWGQIVDQLQMIFPHEADAIKKFFDLVTDVANSFIGVFYYKDPEATRTKYPNLFQYAFRNTMEVLDQYFTDPLLKTLLSVYWGYLGVPPTRLAFAYVALLFFTYIEFKPYHLKGGSQALSNALVNKFLAHGGTVRFNDGAEKILIKNHAVQGVVTQSGEQFQARYIVSNVSPVATYMKLIGSENVPGQVLTEMRGRSLSASAFTMYVGFDCPPDELGITESTNFLVASLDLSDGIRNRMRSLDITDETMVLSCYDVADPEFSPAGTCQANIVTLKYGHPWLRVPPQEYYDVKYRCAEGMLKRVEQVYPGCRRHIEEMEIGTPITHMRYLGHPAGAIYGFEQLTKDSLFFQPGRYSPLGGLYFASGWTGDCGFQPTLEAGQAAAKTIIRQFK